MDEGSSTGTLAFLSGVLGLSLPPLLTQYAGDLGIRPILSPFAIEALMLQYQARPTFALISAPSTLLSHMFVHHDFPYVALHSEVNERQEDSDAPQTLHEQHGFSRYFDISA